MSKSIAKNSIYNVIYKGFSALFPLVTMTYISRILLAEGVGKVSYANTIATYFVLLSALGIPNYGIKAIAQSKDSSKNRTTTLLELFLINFISTTCCIIFYFILINNCTYFSNRKEIFYVFGTLLILNYFNFDWFYQGIEEYSYIATRSIIIKIISFLAMLIFVKKSNDYINYAIILCIATAGNYILNTINLRKYVSKEVNKINLKKHLYPVLILLIASIAQEIYTMLDTLMLEYFYGEIYVGYYSTSVKIIRMVYTLTIAMVGAFYPRISQYIKENKVDEYNKLLTEGTKIILLIAIPAVLGIYMTASYIVPVFFGNSFIPAITTIKILSILIVVFSIAYFLGHIVAMAVGKEKYILKATLAGAIVNFILNIILIPKYKHNGAAIASIFSEVIVTLLLLLSTTKLFKLNISFGYYLSVCIATFCMGISVFIVKSIIKSVWIGMGLSVGLGVVIYFIVLMMMKNEILMNFKNKVEEKLK